MNRSANPMPEFVRKALESHGLRDRYSNALGTSATTILAGLTEQSVKTPNKKRLTQMLDELKSGDVYMKMAWRPRS